MGLNYDVTAKQVLIAHCDEHHRRIKTDRRSYSELSKAHSKDHFKLPLDHDHGSQAGCYTGKDVILKEG